MKWFMKGREGNNFNGELIDEGSVAGQCGVAGDAWLQVSK